MLYDRWRQVASEHRSELALFELASGRRWSFIELARAAESAPSPTEPVVSPQGHCAEFIIRILAAWRARSVGEHCHVRSAGLVLAPHMIWQAVPPQLWSRA